MAPVRGCSHPDPKHRHGRKQVGRVLCDLVTEEGNHWSSTCVVSLIDSLWSWYTFSSSWVSNGASGQCPGDSGTGTGTGHHAPPFPSERIRGGHDGEQRGAVRSHRFDSGVSLDFTVEPARIYDMENCNYLLRMLVQTGTPVPAVVPTGALTGTSGPS